MNTVQKLYIGDFFFRELSLAVFDVKTFKIIERAMDLRGTKFLKNFLYGYKNKCFSYKF